MRSNTEEHTSVTDQQNDMFSSSATRVDSSESEKGLSEHIPQQADELSKDLLTKGRIESHNQRPEESDTKSSSTKAGRNGIVYDDAGNQWNVLELDRKQKNPYRWFIEKQIQKQRAKGPSQDEQAATAMVVLFYI